MATMKPNPGMAEQIARAAKTFEQERSGHKPNSVIVVLSDTTLVITLHGVLSQAEMTLAKDAKGAEHVRDFHRKLFANASASLLQEIEHITGVKVCQAVAELEPASHAVVGIFTTGTTVQVYQLAQGLPASVWSGSNPCATETEDQ